MNFEIHSREKGRNGNISYSVVITGYLSFCLSNSSGISSNEERS